MAPEACWGDDPLVVSPRPVLTAVRFTGESLAHTQESVTSDEIRADSQITDLVRVAVGAEGDINFELSYRTFDRFFEGLLRNDWDAEVDVNNGTGSPQTTSLVIAGSPQNTIASGSPGANFTAIQVGAFIRVSGSTTSPTNDGFYEVLANAGGTLTVSPSFPSAESGTNLRVQASHIRNGTVKKSFLLEKRFTDLSPQQVLYFTGMRSGAGDLSVVPGEILGGTLSFLGKRGFARNGPLSDVAGITENAAPAFDVANAVDNVTALTLDGAALDADLTQITFSVNNNTRDKPAVGSLGNIDIGLGRFNVEGNITAYFSDRTLYDKYLAFTAHSWSFAVDVASNAYLYEFPSIKFSNGVILAEGNDGDVVANMDFQARRDPTKGYTLGLNRFSADVGAEFE
jgi:hypothetical protein